MADDFNPYHQWLGFPAHVRQPNYFQLLHVRPSLAEQPKILRAVEQGVKRNLDLLAKIPPGLRELEQREVRSRIEAARETLADPQRRAGYLASLEAADHDRGGQSRRRPESQSREKRKLNSAPEKPQKQPFDPPVARPVPASQANKQVGPSISDRPIIDTGGGRKQGRGGRVVEWLIKLTVLVALVVGGFLLYQNLDKLLEFTQTAKTVAPSNRLGGMQVPDSAVSGQNEIANVPDDDSPSTGMAAQGPPEIETESPKSATATASNVTSNNEPANDSVGPSDQLGPPSPEPSEKRVLLSADEVIQFHTLSYRVTRHLDRRNWNLADRDLESLAQLVRRDDNRQLLDSTQFELVERWETLRAMRDNLIEFWQQVATSCQALSGSRAVDVNGQVLGFVEATDEYVMLRNAGMNIKYGYDFLPPAIAVELVEEGDIPDNAKWARRKASFYAMNRRDENQFQDRWADWFEVAKLGGQPVAPIEDFLSFQFQLLPNVKAISGQMQGSADIAPAIDQLRSELDYVSPDQVSRQRAAKLIESLFRSVSAKKGKQMAVFTEVVELAVQAVDPEAAEDAIVLMDLPERESVLRQLDAFSKIARQKPASQQRALMESSLPLLYREQQRLKSLDRLDSSDREIARRMERLMADLRKLASAMPDVERRLNQLDQ